MAVRVRVPFAALLMFFIPMPMKRYIYILFLSFLLVACGESKGRFKIEGRFLHINSGELYVYSPDGVIDGMDTIKIQDGRFALEVPCRSDGVLMIVFPNYSQQPIFAESGGAVEVKADASRLRDMEIKGTKANELMTTFRKSSTNMSPPQEVKFAAQFVKDHPESPVSVYLTKKYFVDSNTPDYKQAASLVAVMSKAQKDNGALVRLKQQTDLLTVSLPGKALPTFSAIDVDGHKVTNGDLNAPVSVVSVWASWSFESIDAQNAIADAMKKADGKFKAVSICVDASKTMCRQAMQNNSIDWPVICDGMTINSRLMKQLGLSTVPENILLRNGRIVKSGLNAAQLRQELTKIYH